MLFIQNISFTKLLLSTSSLIGILTSAIRGSVPDYKIITNYNSQADLLISLGIQPDYYPYQLKKTKPYDYLTNIDKYLVVNKHVSSNKKQLSHNLQHRLNTLFSRIQEYGEGIWDRTIYDYGLSFRNTEFWNRKKTQLLLLEQFVADDYASKTDMYEMLPVHKHLIITNHRASRDPFTVFGQDVFDCFKQEDKCNEENRKFKEYVKNYNRVSVNSLYRFGRYIEFWNQFDIQKPSSTNSNIDYSKVTISSVKDLNFLEWTNSQHLFNSNSELDQKMAQWYSEAIFTPTELDLLNSWNKNNEWKINYLKPQPRLAHHSSLEEQRFPGSTPMSEGSQRESILFLYQIAYLIQKFTETEIFEEQFKGDSRYKEMKLAVRNASWIGSELKTRFTKIREYFKSIGVVDPNFDPVSNPSRTHSKSFGVIVYPPYSFGNGDSMLQTISRYPFLYSDIGLKQGIPDVFLKIEHDHESEEMFSIDDHGWWWNLGNVNFGNSNIDTFKGTLDNMMVLSNEDDWVLLSNSPSIKGISYLLKEPKPITHNSYDLWNEGLKNPIALHLILDSLVDMFQKKYHRLETDTEDKKDKYKEAMNWGEYWKYYINPWMPSSDQQHVQLGN